MDEIKDFKLSDLPSYKIMFAVTSEPDYSMARILVAEEWPEYDDFTVIIGYHCSCYSFDNTTWEATKYSQDEIKRLIDGWSSKGDDMEKSMSKLLSEYFARY